MGLLDIIVVGAGLYLLYAYYLLMVKNEIKDGIIVPKDYTTKKCKDLPGFKKYMGPRVLLFSICAILSGGINLFQTYVKPLPGYVFWVFYVLFFVVIFWFAHATRKAQKDFF